MEQERVGVSLARVVEEVAVEAHSEDLGQVEASWHQRFPQLSLFWRIPKLPLLL